MEHEVNASTAGSSGQIVVAGAGYAGLHVALRLMAKLRHHPAAELTLVDRHDYHQVLTELPSRHERHPAPPTPYESRSRTCWPRGSASSRPRSLASTWVPGCCCVRPSRSAGRGWCSRSAAGPTTSPSRAWPSARCRCTQPVTPNECGTRSARRSRRPRPPPPGSSAAWPPWWSAAGAPPESSWPASWPRSCPRWPALMAWRPTGPPCSWSRRARPSWPARHRS